MEQKNTGLIVALVVAILLVLGLGGYIVYDKILSDNTPEEKNDNNNNANDNSSNENSNENVNADAIVIADFGSCLSDDSQKTCITTAVVNNQNVTLTYTKYVVETGEGAILSVNDTIISAESPLGDYIINELYNEVLLHSDFIVFGISGGGAPTYTYIFDYNGNLLVSRLNTNLDGYKPGLQEEFTNGDFIIPGMDKKLADYPEIVNFRK